MQLEDKLDFWFKNNRNVLLVGRHGVGKSSILKECFEKHGLVHGETFLYFSASTLDPWVDLVGVPEKSTADDGTVYLELIRPKSLASGNVVAIFFDEFNRAPKKVRNAVMELMQFKSINGLVFPNLKCVWAAINPEDGQYDVEKIDPAQKDRFHIIQDMPYKPSKKWFTKKYGEASAVAAIEWWNDLPEEEKDKVSPRRLEYALDEFYVGGSIQDVLPISSNATKLIQSLKNGPIETKLQSLFDQQEKSKAKAFLANDNNYFGSIKHIVVKDEFVKFFVPLMPKEKISSLISENTNICKFVIQESSSNKELWSMLREIVVAGQDEKLVKMLHRYVATDSISLVKETPAENPDKSIFVKDPKKISFSSYYNLTRLTQEKSETYLNEIKNGVGENIDPEEASYALRAIAHVSKDVWATSLLKPELKYLVGLINHLLLQMQKKNDINNVLQYYIEESKEISNLFIKLQQANLFGKIVRV